MSPKFFRLKQLTSRSFILAQALLLSSALILNPVQVSLAQKGQSAALHELKLKARQADDNGNADEADRLYVQAIEEAKRTGSKTDVIEMISRLVRERAYNKKFDQADAYVQQALDIVKPLIGTKLYDGEMSVWMDDLADVFYDRGERTTNQRLKDYCARRYLDVELLVRDKPSRLLAGRASMVATSLAHQGRYSEAATQIEKMLDYLQRVTPNDLASISFNYLVLGNNCLGANNPTKAEAAFTRCLQLSEMVKKDPSCEALIARKISMAKAEEGKLDEAKALCKQAIQLHTNSCSTTSPHTAWDAFVLAQLEQRTNNANDAAKYYRLCLEDYEKLSTPASDGPNNSGTAAGLAVSAEGLAQIESKRGNKSLAQSLQSRATKIRAQHPDWAVSKNPNTTEFYAIWGYLPYPVEVIPTRSAAIFGSR